MPIPSLRRGNKVFGCGRSRWRYGRTSTWAIMTSWWLGKGFRIIMDHINDYKWPFGKYFCHFFFLTTIFKQNWSSSWTCFFWVILNPVMRMGYLHPLGSKEMMLPGEHRGLNISLMVMEGHFHRWLLNELLNAIENWWLVNAIFPQQVIPSLKLT